MAVSNGAQKDKIQRVLASLSSATHRAGTLSVDVLERIIELLPGKDILSVETGCGKSTILFSNVARHHTAFCYDDRGFESSSVEFVISNPYFVAERTTLVFGPTQQTLPRHQFVEGVLFDLALIDGPHGFPFPEMEFWHFYPRLAPGALLVIDDVMIPSIARMYDILREDRMFDEVGVFSTTGVLRRSQDPALPPDGDHWWEQAYNFRRFPLSMKGHHRDIQSKLDTELDFSVRSIADRHCVRGFDHRGEDGVVTVDTSAVLRLRFPSNGATTLRMTLRLQMEAAEAGVGGGIVINDYWIADLPADTLEHDVVVSCPASENDDYRVEIRLPAAKPAHDKKNNFNFRRYGCTLRSFKAEADVTPLVSAASHVQATPSQLSQDQAKKTAAIVPSEKPGNGQNAEAKKFKTALHWLAKDFEASTIPSPIVREVIAPPVLCPCPGSPVRFMPLGRQSTPGIAEGLGAGWRGKERWTFVDFVAFEGIDFAYAVCRSLLHRGPNKHQIRVADSGSIGMRFLLLLEADRKARRVGRLGRLVNLSGSRMLYLALRASRKLKLVPLTAMLQMLINFRAKRLLRINHDLLVQRRLALAMLNLLAERK